MRHGFIKIPVIGKIKNLLKPIILDANVDEYTDLKSLFYRADQSAGSVIKVTEDELIQIESLLSSLSNQSDAFKFVCLIANKRKQISYNNDRSKCYFHFDEAENNVVFCDSCDRPHKAEMEAADENQTIRERNKVMMEKLKKLRGIN